MPRLSSTIRTTRLKRRSRLIGCFSFSAILGSGVRIFNAHCVPRSCEPRHDQVGRSSVKIRQNFSAFCGVAKTDCFEYEFVEQPAVLAPHLLKDRNHRPSRNGCDRSPELLSLMHTENLRVGKQYLLCNGDVDVGYSLSTCQLTTGHLSIVSGPGRIQKGGQQSCRYFRVGEDS